MLNYVDQHRVQIDPSKTVWEEVGEGRETVSLGAETVSLRAYLRRFLFREDRMTRLIHQLSGGERSRVLLAKILKRGGNVLLLDEPTNDLDFQTLRLLEEALLMFKGTIVTVSHDRFFLNRICTHTLFFENDGRVVFDVGSFDECRGRQSAAGKNISAAPDSRSPQNPVPNAERKPTRAVKLTWKEQKELEGMETLILQTESELAEKERLFSEPDFYEKHGDRGVELEQACSSLRTKISGLYQRWEELEQKQKSASSAP
jgi:ATP-binding cassette subfamily F protein uup